MVLIKLKNIIRSYSWGSRTSLEELFGIPNPDKDTHAELWMGAHPNGSSRSKKTGQSLLDLINSERDQILGERSSNRFGELPFLFKVLAAEAPLSIQVHPSKDKAEQGFQRENDLGLSIADRTRNYKDPNHKPELVYAITAYKAMNGFRPIETILQLFREIPIHSLSKEISCLAEVKTPAQLREFFKSIMVLNGVQKQIVLNELLLATKNRKFTGLALEAVEYIKQFQKYYPNDIGLLAPLMLNVVELQPGEAMFLYAETPHAYVHGTALEVMANSDNVLRAGLTTKHIDVTELVDNTNFRSIELNELKLTPKLSDNRKQYIVPVDDFCFEVIELTLNKMTLEVTSAEIIFCMEGEIIVESSNETENLAKGESMFVSYEALEYIVSGQGIFARTYN